MPRQNVSSLQSTTAHAIACQLLNAEKKKLNFNFLTKNIEELLEKYSIMYSKPNMKENFIRDLCKYFVENGELNFCNQAFAYLYSLLPEIKNELLFDKLFSMILNNLNNNVNRETNRLYSCINNTIYYK